MITGMLNMANCVTSNKRQLVTAATPVISVTPPSLSVQHRTGYTYTHSIPHTSVTQGWGTPLEAAFVRTVKFCYDMIYYVIWYDIRYDMI